MTWILTPSFIDSALTLVSLEKVDGNVRKSKRAQFKSSAHVCFFPMKSVISTNISFVSRGFVFQNNRFLKNKSIGRGYFIEEIFLIRKSHLIAMYLLKDLPSIEYLLDNTLWRILHLTKY